ncbi:hypothetical protein ACF0H5_000530 [Mactra antiquata]
MRHRKGSHSYLNRRGSWNIGHNSEVRHIAPSPSDGHNFVETSKPGVGFPSCDKNQPNVNMVNQAYNESDRCTPSTVMQSGPECGNMNNATVYSDDFKDGRNTMKNCPEMFINSNLPSVRRPLVSNSKSDNRARDCIVQHCYDMPFMTHTPIPSVIPVYDMSTSSCLRDVNISGYINCAPQLASFAIPLQLTLQPSSGLVVNPSSGLANQPNMVSTLSGSAEVNPVVTVAQSHQTSAKPTVFVAPTKSELKDHARFMESAYTDKLSHDLNVRNTKISNNIVNNDQNCLCGKNNGPVTSGGCCEMNSSSDNVWNHPLVTIATEVNPNAIDRKYTCMNPTSTNFDIPKYESVAKFEQPVSNKLKKEAVKQSKMDLRLKQSKLNPVLKHSKSDRVVKKSKLQPMLAHPKKDKMKNSLNAMPLVFSHCQTSAQPDLNNNFENRQVIDEMKDMSVEGKSSNGLKNVEGTMATDKKGLYRPWEQTNSPVNSSVIKGSKFRAWFEQRCDRVELPNNSDKHQEKVVRISHSLGNRYGSKDNDVDENSESGHVAKQPSDVGQRLKQSILNIEDGGVKYNMRNDGVSMHLNVADCDHETVPGDKVSINTDKMPLGSDGFDFRKDYIRNQLKKKMSESSVLSSKELVLYREMGLNKTGNIAELAHLQMKELNTSTITEERNNRKVKAINSSMIGKKIKVTEVVLNGKDARAAEDKTITDGIDLSNDITENSDCDISAELNPATPISECNITQSISKPKVTSFEKKIFDKLSERQLINNVELCGMIDKSDRKSLTKVDKRVSVLQSMSVAVLNENDFNKETTIGCKTTEYYSSKMNTDLLSVNEMDNETGTVSYEYVLTSNNQSSDDTNTPLVSPIDSLNNSDVLELSQACIQPENDLIKTCSVKSQQIESPFLSLPNSTIHQTCSLSDPICFDKLSDGNCTISQIVPSSLQNMTWFCPTVEEYERYKYSLIPTSRSLAVTSQQLYVSVGNTLVSSSMTQNMDSGPKILNYESLSDPTQQCELTNSVNESTEQSNALVAFDDEMQDTPKEIFDEIVEDILKDTDLMNSISAEDSEKMKDDRLVDGELDKVNDIKTEPEAFDIDKKVTMYDNRVDSDVDINNNSIRSGVRFMGYSRRPYRYQKRFPKPLLSKRPYKVERDLYIAAEKFLGEDFDKTCKRTRRHSAKDPLYLVSPTTGKLESVKLENKNSDESEICSVSKKHVGHCEKVFSPYVKRKAKSEVDLGKTEIIDGRKTRSYVKNKLRNDLDNTTCNPDTCSNKITKQRVHEFENNAGTKTVNEVDKTGRKLSEGLIKTGKKIPTLKIKPVKLDSKERLKQLKMMLTMKLRPTSSKTMKVDNDDLGMTSKVKKSSPKETESDHCMVKKKSCLTCNTSGCHEKYVCEICNYPCDSPLSQRLHFNHYHPLWCSICTRLCPDVDSKMEHLKTVHDIAATCKVCGTNFSFIKKYSLHLHSQYHAENMQKYSQLMKQVWAAKKAQRKEEVIIISDDDFSGTEENLHRVKTKQKPGPSMSAGCKGQKRKMSEESTNSSPTGGTGVLGCRRMPFDCKLKERIVAQYCHVCKQFYIKFQKHKATEKHKHNVIKSSMLLQEKKQKKM